MIAAVCLCEGYKEAWGNKEKVKAEVSGVES